MEPSQAGRGDTHSIMYADDQLLLATGKNPKETIENMNELADEIFEFCYRWKIRINESKSQLLKIFGLKTRISRINKKIINEANITINDVGPNKYHPSVEIH